MFKGNQNVKIKRINMALESSSKPRPSVPHLNLKKEPIVVFNPNTIELVARKIRKAIWPETSEGEAIHFFNLIYAILKCVRRDAYTLYAKEPMIVDSYLKTCFEAMRNMKRPADFDSQLIRKKVNARYTYYEQEFDYRSLIQNYDWDYQYKVEVEVEKDGKKTTKTEFHWLSEDVMLFIKLREKYRLYYEDFKLFKNIVGAPECECCHMPCATFRPSIKRYFCSFCYQYDKLELYLKVCKCFRIVGSYFMFYFNMPESTFLYLFKNKAKIFEVLNQEMTASPVDLYLNEEELKKYQTIKDIVRQEIERQEEGDEMMKLIQELADRGEEEARKKKKESLNTLMLEVNKIKREIRDKKKKKGKEKEKEEEDDDLGIDIEIKSNNTKEEKSMEDAAYYKGLSAYFDPNNQEELGDKSLDANL